MNLNASELVKVVSPLGEFIAPVREKFLNEACKETNEYVQLFCCGQKGFVQGLKWSVFVRCCRINITVKRYYNSKFAPERAYSGLINKLL